MTGVRETVTYQPRRVSDWSSTSVTPEMTRPHIKPDITAELVEKCKGYWKKSSSLVQHFLCCSLAGVRSQVKVPHPEPPMVGVDNLLKSLDQVKVNDSTDDIDLSFITNFLNNNEFQSLLKVQEKVTTPEAQESNPVTNHVTGLAEEVCHVVRCWHDDAATQLLRLLKQPHLQALFRAHDQVAMKAFIPHLPEDDSETEDESKMKIVRLIKDTTEPLGATIQRKEETGEIIVARVMTDGAAYRTGMIHVGDKLREVSGVSMRGKAPEEVVEIVMTAVSPVILKLVPVKEEEESETLIQSEGQMRIRTCFSYNPDDDRYIPCPEAGLAFTSGDILHVVNQDDDLWWQARHDDDYIMRAGIIPSPQLQQWKNRLQYERISEMTNGMENEENMNCNGLMSRSSPCYDEVGRFYPTEGQYRSIVLIGYGCRELRRRLIEVKSDHYTTPSVFSDAFVNTCIDKYMSRQEMEEGIQSDLFVEYCEDDTYMYGTSLAQVCDVIIQGYACVLCPHPEALETLRNPMVKPCVIFVKPPCIERLRELRNDASFGIIREDIASTRYGDDDLHQVIEMTHQIETEYSQHFDHVILYDGMEKAVNQLCFVAKRLDSEPQWVPISWINNNDEM